MSDLDAFLDALAKRMDDRVEKFGREERPPMIALQNMIAGARRDVAEATPEAGWSEWLAWAGGECPLPPDAEADVEYRSGPSGIGAASSAWRWKHHGGGADITRFRYRCLPGGWVARPKGWVPPESAWPLMTRDKVGYASEWRYPQPDHRWQYITHIRLLPRSKPEPVEMPEGWWINRDGDLMAPDGVLVLRAATERYFGRDTIRAALSAWLDQMGKRR